MKKAKKGFVAHRDKFKVEVKYSDKALKKDLIRFTVKKGNVIEISAGDIVDLIAPHFNVRMMSPLIVKNNIIRMVEVTRTLHGVLTRDWKAGENITFPYKHLVPFELAACEEAMNLGKVEGRPIRTFELSEEDWEKAKKSVNEGIKNFTSMQYKEQLDRVNADKDTAASLAALSKTIAAPEE